MGCSLLLLKGILVEQMEIDSKTGCLQEEGDELFSNKEKNRNRQKLIEDYRTLKIAMHNINGIKGSFSKLELLLDWAKKEKIDIIGINETNTTERQNKFNISKQEEFVGIWSDAETNKKKGSGVGLLINRK